jgi:8-oxo-dGTP pyrophosphatase MutT (NUDIX family)
MAIERQRQIIPVKEEAKVYPQNQNDRFTTNHAAIQERNKAIVSEGTPVFEGGPAKWLTNVTFATPNGNDTREVVVRDSGTITITTTEDGKFVFIQQFRPPTGEYTLEFPGGGIKPGETPHDAGQRELREELGVRKITQARPEFYSRPTPYMSTEAHYFFSATVDVVGLAHQTLDVTESIHSKPVVMPPSEALDAIRDGRITHGPTVQGVLWHIANERRD